MEMSSLEFYSLTPAETVLKIKGYEHRRWEGWQQARLISYNVYLSVPRKKGFRCQKIEEFYPLPSDDKHKSKITEKKMGDVWDKLKDR